MNRASIVYTSKAPYRVDRMRKLFFDHALLPEGWAKNIGLDIEGGSLAAVVANAQPQGRERIAGIALPGLGNVHSHSFQRAQAGPAGRPRPPGDTFLDL